jgi:hypothetical protein
MALEAKTQNALLVCRAFFIKKIWRANHNKP